MSYCKIKRNPNLPYPRNMDVPAIAMATAKVPLSEMA